jgi:hypothetical protein
MGINSQKGMTTTSALFTLFLVGFILTVVFKLGPHYLDNRIIQGAIDQVAQSDINGKSNSQIRRKIADFFTINNIRDIDLRKVAIDREDSGIQISLDYEKRIEMFGNIDVVLKFSNKYEAADNIENIESAVQNY